MSTPITLDNLLDLSHSFDAAKEDYDGKQWQFGFDIEANLEMADKVNPGVIVLPHRLTKHAWEQFAGKMGPMAFGKGSGRSLPVDALLAWKETYPEELATLLNRHIVDYKSGLLVRAYQTDKGEDTVRAVLSDRYAIVDNSHVLDVARQALQTIEHQNHSLNVQLSPFACTVTPDGMHVKIELITVNTDDGPYSIGCYLGNNEIGMGKIRALPFWKRNRCDNSTVHADDDSKLDAVHRGAGQILADRMAIAIFHAFRLSQEHLATFLNSREIIIPDFEAELLRFCDKQGWGVEMTGRVMRGTEGRDSLFGFINGLTYAAQGLTSMDDRVNLEIKAGDILMQPDRYFRLPAPVAQEV